MTTRNHPNPIQRYGVAILVTLFALFVRLALGRLIQASSPFVLFTPAVMLSAWYGGMGPGVLSTAVGAILGNYFLLAPEEGFSTRPEDLSRMAVFVVVGVQITWLSQQMHNARRRAEDDAAAARRSEKLYRTLASNFPDGFVCLFDATLRWTLVEGSGLAGAGLNKHQLESGSVLTTLPAPTARQFEPLCRDALAGTAASAEVAHAGRVYQVHALPVRDETGAVASGMAIVEDVTERVRARDALQDAHDNLERRVAERTAELHFQKTLLESQSQASRDGIIAVDDRGRVIFANRRFYEMWDLRIPHGADGSLDSLRPVMRERLVSQADPLAQDGFAGGVAAILAGTDELALSDGRTIERYSAPIIDPQGTSYGRVWFFGDVTERKRLEREILEAGERERQRIGQDLHDDLCQQLTGIACLGRVLQQRLKSADDTRARADSDAAARLVSLVQDANKRARDLAKGLQPVELQRHGLPSALQDLCASITGMFGTPCEFRGEDTATAGVSEVTSTQLYRIAQEAITNAVRHGHPQHVLVDLVVVRDRLIMTIEDDGVGLPDPVPQHGLGLHTMNYRARTIGGTLVVDRRSPTGTVVTCSVDLVGAAPSADSPALAGPATTPLTTGHTAL